MPIVEGVATLNLCTWPPVDPSAFQDIGFKKDFERLTADVRFNFDFLTFYLNNPW